MAQASKGPGSAGDDRRRSTRIRTLLNAIAHDEESAQAWDCLIRNVSVTGARLELKKPLPLPTEFRLDVPCRNLHRFAVVVWRDAALVGIRFRTDPRLSRRARRPQQAVIRSN